MTTLSQIGADLNRCAFLSLQFPGYPHALLNILQITQGWGSLLYLGGGAHQYQCGMFFVCRERLQRRQQQRSGQQSHPPTQHQTRVQSQQLVGCCALSSLYAHTHIHTYTHAHVHTYIHTYIHLPHSGFLSQVKTFVNFAFLWRFMKVLSTKINLESVTDAMTSWDIAHNSYQLLGSFPLPCWIDLVIYF